MSIRRTALLTVATAAVLATGAAAAATGEAATGQVVAFTADLLPVRVYDDPTGCNTLPTGTHVIFNETDRPIDVYTDPLCLIPLEPVARLAPGRSTHASAIGAFRA